MRSGAVLFGWCEFLTEYIECDILIINRDYSWLVGWFVPIFSVPRFTKRADVQKRMLCYIQKTLENPHEKKYTSVTHDGGTMDVGLLTYLACTYVYDICMSVRRGC